MCTQTRWTTDAELPAGAGPLREREPTSASAEARRMREWRGRPITVDVAARLLESLRAERPE